MTNSFPNINPQCPTNYSGVTIQITSPTVNAGVPGMSPQLNSSAPQGVINSPYTTNPMPQLPPVSMVSNGQNGIPQQVPYQNNMQTYPAQYYLNNYNYAQPQQPVMQPQIQPMNNDNGQITLTNDINNTAGEQNPNLETSKEIINEINNKVEQEKEAEKNGSKKRIVALTNDYIKSLENYLNNNNDEIRVMAAKEVLTRLDEDKNRFDDPALTALLNKMLQDPNDTVRWAALSAFSANLAKGDDFTIELIQKMQNNPNSSKEDVVEAANILLKLSSTPDYTNTKQVNKNNTQQSLEQENK